MIKIKKTEKDIKTRFNMIMTIIVGVLAFAFVANADPEDWDQDDFDAAFDPDNRTIQFQANEDGYRFIGDILIPGDPEITNGNPDPYTIEFLPGAEVLFDEGVGRVGGSLTIRVNGNGAEGRINAHGAEGNMVTFQDIDGRAWGDVGLFGILIQSNPDEGNLLDYCEVTGFIGQFRVQMLGILVQIDGSEDVAQATISNCLIRDNERFWDNQASGVGIHVTGPDVEFSVTDCEIRDCGDGIVVVEDIDLDDDVVINRNFINGCMDTGIHIRGEFSGMIVNNLIQDSESCQLRLWFNNSTNVSNNILDGAGNNNAEGAQMSNQDGEEWVETFQNNIIMNCNVGIRAYVGGGAGPEVDNCLLFNNTTDYEDCQEGDNIITNDPQFVDYNNGDFHLAPISLAIDAGNNDIVAGDETDWDLNFTSNDMGIYGGKNASPEMAAILFGTVVDGQHEIEVSSIVPEEYEYIVPADVEIEFSASVIVEDDAELTVEEDVVLTFTDGNLNINGEATIADGVSVLMSPDNGVYVNGDMDVSGTAQNYTNFNGINGGNWSGINFGNQGGHNSIINYAEISGSVGYGLDWSGSYISSVQNCLIHDNETGIHTSLITGAPSIQNSDIYDNDNYGILGTEVAHDVWILNSSIHDNGLDGIKIGGETSIDGCDVYLNGNDGINLYYGDAQIINCDIYQNSYSGIRLTGWQQGNGTILVGAQDGTNHIHNNGQYGMYVTDIHFINECNIIENNPLYGIWVMGNFPAYFNTDHIRLNGPSTIGTGIGFNNGFAVMNHTSSDSNYYRGMEAYNLSWIDMSPPQQDPLWMMEDSCRFMNNGWTPQPPPLWAPIANVEEIFLGSAANIWITNGSCDIYDNRIVGGDLLISRNPNLAGVINGLTCYFGIPPINPNVAFNPWNLVINFVQQAIPNYLNTFEEDQVASGLLAEATRAMRLREYEDADEILRRILTDYTETPSAASCPGLLQVCIRELDLDLVDNREFIAELDIDENNEGLLRSREHVVNMLHLYAGNYDEAIESFTDIMENAESLQDSVEAALNLAYAEHIRDFDNEDNEVDGVGAPLDDKVTELLQLMHSDRPFVGAQPTEFELKSVYPNPFNSIATINYSVPEVSHLNISIYDLTGRQVSVVYEGERSAGNYSVVWEAGDIASGIYICRIKANEHIQNTKMTLLR